MRRRVLYWLHPWPSCANVQISDLVHNTATRKREERPFSFFSQLSFSFLVLYRTPHIMSLPLSGLTVFEMGGLAPAPYAGMILSDFGADVIRIDRPKAMSTDVLAR